MANGPFGNPLTTGIALTFDVDMTPYDNMLKRNAAKAAEKAKADKDLLDKYNEYAKNITVDFDKIHWRLHEPARAKYAETLAELNKAVMNKDPHAVNMLMMDSKQFNYNLVQRTSEWNEIFNQDPTKVYYDPSIKQKINDRSIPTEDAQITEIFTKYGTTDELIGSCKKAPSRRKLKTDVDNLVKGAVRRLQPGDKPTMYLPTGEAVYEPKYTNKDETRNQVIMDYTSPQNIESTIYMLTEDYGISPSELQGKDIPETQEKLTNAINRVFDPIWSSIESEQYKSRFPKEGGGGFSFSMGSGKSEESIFNKSGGRELKIEGGNVLKTKGQYDITFTKGAGKTTMDVTDGSYEIDQNTGEFKKTNVSGSLSDAIPVAPIVDENGQEWYMAISQGDVADKDVNLATLLLAIRQDPDADTLSLVQKELAKAKYGKTYLIKGNDSVRNQFWQKTLGQDYTKQRAADAMKELGLSQNTNNASGLPDLQ